MGRGRVAACVGVVGMVVAMFACGQLVGIGNDPPQGPIAPFPDSGAEGGFTYGQGTCATCVATNCETEATMCAANPSCSTLASCMSAANGDATLRAQCGVDHGLGPARLANFRRGGCRGRTAARGGSRSHRARRRLVAVRQGRNTLAGRRSRP